MIREKISPGGRVGLAVFGLVCLFFAFAFMTTALFSATWDDPAEWFGIFFTHVAGMAMAALGAVAILEAVRGR